MSNAFAALIWWVVPAIGLIGALGYVTWVSKFQGKFQQETQRSVGQFQRFQDSLRDSQARDVAEEHHNTDDIPTETNGSASQISYNTTGESSFSATGEKNPKGNPPQKSTSRISVIRPDAN